jgi:hypothetical protein
MRLRWEKEEWGRRTGDEDDVMARRRGEWGRPEPDGASSASELSVEPERLGVPATDVLGPSPVGQRAKALPYAASVMENNEESRLQTVRVISVNNMPQLRV